MPCASASSTIEERWAKNEEDSLEVDLWDFLAFSRLPCLFLCCHRDQQKNAGVDRLSTMKLPLSLPSMLNPNLKLVSERSPYMRTER